MINRLRDHRCALIARCAILLFAFLSVADAEDHSLAPQPTVVLMHGLARSSTSMSKMERHLQQAGFRTCNVSYPSRHHAIETLTANYVAPAIRDCMGVDMQPVHFVTHSLGGIIVRQLSATDKGFNFGRVVMLSPPNGGSEVVDKLGDLWLFQKTNGPAGGQLGTGTDALPHTLGDVAFELGVITGKRTINPFLSLLIPGSDDGKVSIDSAKLNGMRDFLVIAASHPFIMRNDTAIRQTEHFLRYGVFAHHEDTALRPAID